MKEYILDYYDFFGKSDFAEVYLHKNRPQVMGFCGKAQKPSVHYGFKSIEAAKEFAFRWLYEVSQKRQLNELEKQKRKEEKAAFKHTLEIGDIMQSSWGYEQTNVDCYQVIAKTDKTVTLQKIRLEMDQGDVPSSMAAWVKPIQGALIPDTISKHKVFPDNVVRFTSYKRAYKWDGKRLYNSWYA